MRRLLSPRTLFFFFEKTYPRPMRISNCLDAMVTRWEVLRVTDISDKLRDPVGDLQSMTEPIFDTNAITVHCTTTCTSNENSELLQWLDEVDHDQSPYRFATSIRSPRSISHQSATIGRVELPPFSLFRLPVSVVTLSALGSPQTVTACG